MKYLIITLFFSVFLTSCKDESVKKAEHIIHVDIKNAKSQDISETFQIIDIVNLELTDETMIKEISKIYVTEKYILVIDLRKNDILLFNQPDGKFIRKIGTKGQGPGEYIMFNDVIFEEESGKIYAHERVKRTMQIYELSGQLIEELPCKYWFNAFCKTKEGYWVYSCHPEENPEGYALMLLNNDLTERVNGFFPQKKFFTYMEGTKFFKDVNNRYYFTYQYSTIVYQLDKGEPIPYFQVDFGSKTLPYERIKSMDDAKDYRDLVSKTDYLQGISNPQLYNDKFYFSFFNTSGKSIQYSAIYDMMEKHVDVFKSYRYYLPSITTSLAFQKISFSSPIGIYKDQLIYSISPDGMEDKDLSLLKENVSESIDSESNPILFFVREI